MHAKWAAAAIALILPATILPAFQPSARAGVLPLLLTEEVRAGIVKTNEIAAPAAASLVASLRPLVAPLSPIRASLPPLVVRDLRVPEAEEFRLYDGARELNGAEIARFRALLGEGTEVPVHARTIQLLARASYHFGGARVIVVSSFRKGQRHGPHGTGAAIDFQLVGVSASKLASYLRKQPKVGVGVYTHPKTQFVHLDDRETSYHWLDASPPGAHWRERAMKDANRETRDATYTPAMDLPEAFTL